MSATSHSELPNDPAFQRHYSVTEIAKLWGRSYSFVSSLFENEPGVLKVYRDGTLKKRRYCVLSIPESVVIRVRARLEAK